MIEPIYFIGGSFAAGVGLGALYSIIKKRKDNKPYREFHKAVKENERLFNKLFDNATDEDYEMLADCLKNEMPNGKNLISKLD